jgi:hypothetical protein
MTEEVKAPEESVEEETPTLADHLKNFSGAPDSLKLEEWKGQYGEVFASGFSPEEIFVWRPLSRAEFADMQTRAQEEMFDSEALTVEQCVLWASEPAKKSLSTKAGTLTTLHEQIMQNSNFMPPAMAAQLVMKL